MKYVTGRIGTCSTLSPGLCDTDRLKQVGFSFAAAIPLLAIAFGLNYLLNIRAAQQVRKRKVEIEAASKSGITVSPFG
jgi:hypothetical protein